MADERTISKEDIRAAVSGGILTETQAVNLQSLSDSRRGARENLSASDEPFELFKGFNEIFIVVGIGILVTGWLAAVSASHSFWVNANFPAVIGLGGGVLWLLSEYFVRKRRMVAPAIALSILFSLNAAFGLMRWFMEPLMMAQGDSSSAILPAFLTAVATLIYWVRFRVPIALALVSLCLFATITLAANQDGKLEDWTDLFLLTADGPFAYITLLLGVVVFIIAMAFDTSDPHRVTRRSANGFWLHVVAAPMMINTLALTLLTEESYAPLIAVLLVFSLVAIVIDRRSFLITAVGYCVAISAVLDNTQGAAWSIVILGVALLLLGALWERIRAILLRLFSGVLPLQKLPPAYVK